MVKSGCEECNSRLNCANLLLWPSSMLSNTLTQKVDMKFSSVMKFKDCCVLKIQSRDISAKQYRCWVGLVMEWWVGDSANRKLTPELLGCAARLKLKVLSGISLLGARSYLVLYLFVET